MRTIFGNSAIIQHGNDIGHSYGAESMGYQDTGFPWNEIHKMLEHFVFGLRIQRRSRFVQNKQIGIADVGAGQRDFLPFTA